MILRDIPFTIPRDKVLLRLKFNVNVSKSNEKIDHLIDSMMDEGYMIAQSRASIQDFYIKENKMEEIRLVDTNFIIRGRKIAEHLKNCFKISFMVCTIGDEFTQAVESLSSGGEITKAVILDAVGSEAIEALADTVTNIIKQNAKTERADIITRFSPGYGDWPVAEQKELLKIVEAKKIGVRLTEQYLMIPEKSISACIGWIKRNVTPP